MEPLARPDNDGADSGYLEAVTRSENNSATSAYLAVVVNTDDDSTSSSYLAVVAGLNDDVSAGYDNNRPTLSGSVITTSATVRQRVTGPVYDDVEHAPYDDIGRDYNVAVDQVGVSDCPADSIPLPTVVSRLQLR